MVPPPDQLHDALGAMSGKERGSIAPVMALIDLVRAMARANAERDIAIARAGFTQPIETKSGSGELGSAYHLSKGHGRIIHERP